MPAITIDAPAKLNFHLKVGGKRPDGFHDIESLFVALDFGDTLYCETTPSETTLEITMNGPLALQLDGENIISRAVSLFRDRTGFDQGLKVTVEKRIPFGGGLGGGSSDAAAALLALNCLAADGGSFLNAAELAEMGAFLGSDVPFFLYNSPAAWVTGRGEQIQPLELPGLAPKYALVLVNPGFSSDTAEAYRLLDDIRLSQNITTEFHGGKNLGFSTILNHLKTPCTPWLNNLGTNSTPQDWPFFNDFLPVLLNSDKGAVYQRIMGELRELGAGFAGLSGSGSTCFGVFSREDQAESARKTLSERWPFVIISFLLVRRTIPCYNRK